MKMWFMIKSYNFTIINTLGSRNPGPLTFCPSLTILTPSKNKADAAKELPNTFRILDMNTGSPLGNTRPPRTPRRVISKIGFMMIDRIVWITTRHFPLKSFLLLSVSLVCVHLSAGDSGGVWSLFLFWRFVISMKMYPMGLRTARLIGAIK